MSRSLQSLRDLRTFLPAAAAAVVLALPAARAADAQQPAFEQPRPLGQQLSLDQRRRIDSVFAHLDRTDSPGCVVGISLSGRMVYTRGYGMSDLQHRIALGPNSIFHVASISKQFTALSVALLAEEGKLSLDDDVRRHVPEVPDLGVKLTVRQLIHHTSGLRDQWGLLAYAGWRGDDVITEQDVLRITARQRGLNFRPGDEYVYSNTGYTLLAVIVQRVSGQSLRRFAHERFFEPLGMRDTHFHDDHTMIVPGRTSAYQPRQGVPGAWQISIPVFDTYGATSLFTTAEDLLRWMAHLDAPRIGSPALWRAAVTSGVLNDGTPINYGYGLSIGRWRGQEVIGHSGADAGYRADALRLPAHGLAIAVLCNAANGNPGALLLRVAEALIGDKLPRIVEARAIPHQASPAALARWVGTYRDTVSHAVLRVRVSGDSLFFNNQHRPLGSDTTAPAPNGNGFAALRAGASGVPVIAIEPKGLREVRWVRQEPGVTTPEALRAFAGSYRGDELDITYEIALRDSVLVRTHRKLNDGPLVTAGRDAFTLGGTTYLFTRDRRGRVTGFTINDGRIRGVRFVRVPTP
jgi:CubicO group peptidase (beta-lactamase class C family)